MTREDPVRTIPCHQCGERLPVDVAVVVAHVNAKHPVIVGPAVALHAAELRHQIAQRSDPSTPLETLDRLLAASPADGAGVDVERLFRAFWESDAYWLFHNPKHQEPEERFRRMVRAAVAEYDRLAALEGASDGTREGSG